MTLTAINILRQYMTLHEDTDLPCEALSTGLLEGFKPAKAERHRLYRAALWCVDSGDEDLAIAALDRFARFYERVGDYDAASGTGRFQGAPPCICGECRTYRATQWLLEEYPP